MPKITELYAWIVADTGPDDESVPMLQGDMNGSPTAMPLVGADMDRAESLRELAQVVADKAGKPLKLVRSSQFEILDWVKPKK